MEPLTIIADPCTGLVDESATVWNDAETAFRMRRQEFRHLQPATRTIVTPDGCTVGDNAAWLTPGEWICWDGPIAHLG